MRVTAKPRKPGAIPTLSDPFAEANAAQRRAADPGVSVWVGASAGTGKTKVLTDRVLCLPLAGIALSRRGGGKALVLSAERGYANRPSCRRLTRG